jgi:formylglycine-generating enzyme required for sulfatase activity
VESFLADRHEVTNAEYAKFLQSLPEGERMARVPKHGFAKDAGGKDASPLSELEDRPVVGLRPEDARAYAAWRGKRDGAVVRLPTEAEWALMTGAAEGWILANGFQGGKADGQISGELQPAGTNPKDVGDHGVAGLFGNAREMTTGLFGDVPEGGVLVKGAGVGDEPDAGAIHLVRKLPGGERQDVTGFRCVTELK